MYTNLAASADPTEHPREPKDSYEQTMKGQYWHAGQTNDGRGDSWFDDFSDNV